MSTQRITPKSGKWQVKRDGANKASGIFNTQKEAIDSGRKIAQNTGAELVICGKNGQIRQKDSHGKDSFPPKG